MMIHVYGKIRLVQDEALFALLSRLVHKHEANTGYSLEALPQDFVQKQTAGIVGFAVAVTRH